MFFALAGLMIFLVAACGSASYVPSETAMPLQPTATVVTPVPTQTPMVTQEWKLDGIEVVGDTVVVSLQLYAGIDVGVTVGGAAPSRVDGSVVPILKFIFENVTPGEHPIVISDVVGFSETSVVLVQAPSPGSDDHPAWLADWVEELESGKVEFPPQSITSYQYQNAVVYYVVKQCCDQFSDLLDAEGNLIGHPDGGITGRGDGVTEFSTEGLEGEEIWSMP
jgi:hypothetical protein